jgi:hypothetical protein
MIACNQAKRKYRRVRSVGACAEIQRELFGNNVILEYKKNKTTNQTALYIQHYRLSNIQDKYLPCTSVLQVLY